MRLSLLTPLDIFFGIVMILIGLDIGRRVIGWTLTITASFIILYTIFGNIIPGEFGHSGFYLKTVISQVYCGLEGYYGIVSRVMIIYVIPFILLGAFLEKTGAGEFFINLSFSLTRNTVGGPAKAAILGSALLGSISGSAIANVSSTGVFTIPMMKRIGYKPHVAGAIEAAASTGGQIMPPIMGAVAFLMVEFTQIPYLTIISVAAIPIVLYYMTLFVFIHFEAKKYNISVDNTISTTSTIDILKTGWQFFFSIIAIIFIMGFGFAPNVAALGGILILIVVHMLKNRSINLNFIYQALILGGKYSLNIGSIIACIGIIIALVGLTGLGLKLSWFLSELTSESAFLAILIVGAISTILGMGLPSSAAYIIVAITAGPTLVKLGFPILIAHMIMIWYSINSEITPPVGLASIVGAGIAGSDPMKTMLTAFKFSKGLYILPFMFYFRPAILLQGSFPAIIETIASVLFGLVAFAAFWENFLYTKLQLLERLFLLFAAFLLFFPNIPGNAIGIILFISVVFSQKVSIQKQISGKIIRNQQS
jgi:TRAP transporter 4TM/12TM fusion protein